MRIIRRKDIEIAHLAYTVKVRPIKNGPPSEIPHAQAWVERCGRHGCTLHLPQKLHLMHAPLVAHELVHVLRYLCEDRHMDFTRESEHMAYIMQHLMGQIFGFVWLKR